MVSTQLQKSLADAPDESVREVLRQGEVCLDGILQLAFAADQRGTTMSGICGAGAAAFVAAAVTLQAGAEFETALVVGSYVAAICFFAAALVFAWSSRPIDFYIAGYEPKLLSECVKEPKWTMIFIAEDLQRRIAHNGEALEKGARCFRLGFALAVIALPAGLLAMLTIPS